jgi:tRNA (Thr-GGU) A37 N-methylase
VVSEGWHAEQNPVCMNEWAGENVGARAERLRLRGVDMADGSPVVDLKATLRSGD